jgi:hypothetical protein
MAALSGGGKIAFILLHEKLELGSILCTLYIHYIGLRYRPPINFISLAGKINENSKKCVGSWKRNSGWKMRGDDKKLL